MPGRRLAISAVLMFFAGPVWAEQISLSPNWATVTVRSYGFGLLPLDGNFTRFRGWLRYDPAHQDTCQIILDVEAASLAMANSAVRDRITGPEFMDTARLPQLSFRGACQGDVIVGNLLLHGETHPFTLDLKRQARIIQATGRLRREDWGMTTRSLLAGDTIRIRVELPDPLAGNQP